MAKAKKLSEQYEHASVAAMISFSLLSMNSNTTTYGNGTLTTMVGDDCPRYDPDGIAYVEWVFNIFGYVV